MHHLYPSPPPCERKNLSRITYIGDRNFEGKNYTQFWEKKSPGNRQKWAKNTPFASVFQQYSRGDPEPPPLLRQDKILPLNGPLS